jgi:hypothetical protein
MIPVPFGRGNSLLFSPKLYAGKKGWSVCIFFPNEAGEAVAVSISLLML